MSENLLYRIRSGDVQLLEEAVLSWKRNCHDGELVSELEGALRVCLALPDQLQEVWHSALRREGISPAAEYQQTGESLRELFNRALRTAEALRELIADFQNKGHSIRPDGLERTIERLNLLCRQFVDSWLWITPEIIQEARQEYARGEYQTVREIMDELQSKNPQLRP